MTMLKTKWTVLMIGLAAIQVTHSFLLLSPLGTHVPRRVSGDPWADYLRVCDRPKRATHTLLLALRTADAATARTNERLRAVHKFNIAAAVRLGAFAFSVYGDPENTRWYRTPDGTLRGFLCDDLVRDSFDSMLLIHLVRARHLPGEQGGLVQKIFTGRECDPYVITEVVEEGGSDVAMTKAKTKTNNPTFYERFVLYVKEPSSAKLRVTVKDKNVVEDDNVVGVWEGALYDLFEGEKEGRWEGEVELQPHEGAELPAGRRHCGKGAELPAGRRHCGKVEMDVDLVPLGSPDADEGEEGMLQASASGEREDDEGDAIARQGPSSVLEGIDWNELGSKAGGDALGLGRYQLSFFLTNEETDTQAGIWRHPKGKDIIISFRGTESLKDVLADMMIMQEPLTGPGDDRLVHTGFLRQFTSVRESVYACLDAITNGRIDKWNIDVTGHSLGGALACLMAHDLATRYPQLVSQGRLLMYSFGAPRVGNRAFCQDYDDKLRDVSFRVVNDMDIVPRMPRGVYKGFTLDYDHCGRTVFLSENFEERGVVWVEGESDGTCPLREVQVFDGDIDLKEQMADAMAKAGAPKGGKAPSLTWGEGSWESLLPSTDLFDALQSQVMNSWSSDARSELSGMFRLSKNFGLSSDGSMASVQDMMGMASNMTRLNDMLKPSPSTRASSFLSKLPLLGDVLQRSEEQALGKTGEAVTSIIPPTGDAAVDATRADGGGEGARDDDGGRSGGWGAVFGKWMRKRRQTGEQSGVRGQDGDEEGGETRERVAVSIGGGGAGGEPKKQEEVEVKRETAAAAAELTSAAAAMASETQASTAPTTDTQPPLTTTPAPAAASPRSLSASPTMPPTTMPSRSYIASVLLSLGVDASVVEYDLQLAESLLRGSAIAHHMEPLYFLALDRGLRMAMEEVEREKGEEEKGKRG